MTNKEIVDMIKLLKEQAVKSCNDTAIIDVKKVSFDFVMDSAIKALSQEQQSEWERDHEILKAYADGQESMKPCWIPVGERLPEIHQNVLLSLRSLDVEVGFRGNTEPYYYYNGDYIEPQNVLAWMPLPQPYKAESEDEE